MNQSIDKDNIYGWPLRFLQWFCPPHLYEEIEGDLIQRFHRDVKLTDPLRAKRRLTWTVLRFFRPEILLQNVKGANSGKLKINLFIADFNLQKANNLIGWIVFLIAFLVYSLTV